MTDFAATTEQKLGLSDRWALIRADRSFHLLFRTICVGAVLSALAVLSLSVERQEAPRGDRVARLAKPRMPASPLMQLTQGDGESALDSDFSLEQAALTWSHRLGKETAEADAVGVMRFGPVKVHQSIVERVVQAATRTEMDPALLMAIADKESNFSTN